MFLQKKINRTLFSINIRNVSTLSNIFKALNLNISSEVYSENKWWFNQKASEYEKLNTILKCKSSKKTLCRQQRELDLYSQSKINRNERNPFFNLSDKLKTYSEILDRYYVLNFFNLNLSKASSNKKIFYTQIYHLKHIFENKNWTFSLAILIIIGENITKYYNEGVKKNKNEDLESIIDYDKKVCRIARLDLINSIAKDISLYYKKNFIYSIITTYDLVKEVEHYFYIEDGLICHILRKNIIKSNNIDYDKISIFLKKEIKDDFHQKVLKNKKLTFINYIKSISSFDSSLLIKFILDSIAATGLLQEETVRMQNNVKQLTVYIIKESTLDILISSYVKFPTLPRIVSPGSWDFSNTRKKVDFKNLSVKDFINNQSYSGLINNDNCSIGIEGAITHKNGSSHSIISNTGKKVLNYLQSRAYLINEKFFAYWEKNFASFLLPFLLMNSKLTKEKISDILIYHDSNVVTIRSWIEYLTLRLEYEEKIFFYRYQERSIDENTKKWLIKKKYLTTIFMKEYTTLFSLIKDYLSLYLLAKTFKGYILYFFAYYDFRFRAYIFGYLLFPFSNRLGKQLLDMLSTENSCTISTRDSVEYMKILKKLEHSQKPKDFFSKVYAFQTQQMFSWVGLDARCSGLSIGSAICGDEKGMLNTNVFFLAGKEPEEGDPYKIIADETSKKLKEILPIKFPHLADFENQWIIDETSNFFNRDSIKSWLMKKIYAQKKKARIENMYEFFTWDFKNSFKKHFGIENQALQKNKEKFKELKQYCVISEQCFCIALEAVYPSHSLFIKVLTSIIEDTWESKNLLKENFDHFPIEDQESWLRLQSSYMNCKGKRKNLATLKLLLDYLIDKNKLRSSFLIIGSDLNDSVSFNYVPLMISKKHPTLSTNISLQEASCTPDVEKFKLSVIAHFTHSLDAKILSRVVLMCQKLGIDIFCLHDAFHVKIWNISIVRKIYFQAYVEELLLKDPLDHFIKNNDMFVSEENRNILNRFSIFRKEIFSKIHSGSYLPSDKILN